VKTLLTYRDKHTYLSNVRERDLMKKMFRTSDIAHAAYLMLKGLKLTLATREPSGKFKFEFEDPNELAKSYVVEYITSNYASFDTHLKNLKKLLY